MATALGRTVQLDAGVCRTEWAGGPVVVTEAIPEARSVSLGLWVRWGAAHEPPEFRGLAHLLEHMVFKGTDRRSARQIAAEIEGVGGHLDACTSREQTLFQARLLGAHLERAVDVLADLVFHPRLRADDLELERKVILEEIGGVEDTPDDLVFDLHARALWGDHPYGHPILGTRESVCAIGAADLATEWARAYRPFRCVVAAAGQVEHEALLEWVGRFFPAGGGGGGGIAPETEVATPEPRFAREEWVERDAAQVHLCAGVPTFPYRDPRRAALEVASMALGGGMSSRLFQRVREELGLAYAIFAFHSLHRRAGQVTVYAGTEPGDAERTLDEIRAELARIGREPMPEEELKAAKNQVNGQRVLALESTTARMARLAQFSLYDEPYETIDEALARTEAVDAEAVRAVAREFLEPDTLTVVRLGPRRA